ncbi:diphthine--ammonia ligase, partial [archaeon]|nr:diphthine--ammonia ligase [archaeon]
MKVGVLTSGGKDSLFAAFKALKAGHELACLISLKPKNPDSYMFHVPNLHLVPLQAKAMKLPLISMKSSGEKEIELKDLKKAIAKAKKEFRIEGIVSGALASNYQKTRVDKICRELKLESIAPLWLVEPEAYLHELIKEKFEVIVVGIAAFGLNESWLGRKLDRKAIEELVLLEKKLGFHAAFEGGEAETLVLSSPLFNGKKIKVLKA